MSGTLPPLGPAPGTSHAEMVARVVRLEAGQRRLAVALGLVVVVTAVAIAMLVRETLIARHRVRFDSVSARRFVVMDGDSARGLFGMYEAPHGAALMLGTGGDGRGHLGVGLHERGILEVRGQGGSDEFSYMNSTLHLSKVGGGGLSVGIQGDSTFWYVLHTPHLVSTNLFPPGRVGDRRNAAFLDPLHRAFGP